MRLRLCALLGLSLLLLGAATITVNFPQRSGIVRMTIALTSDGSGDVSGTIAAAYADALDATGVLFSGMLARVTINYDDATTPTTGWDLRILDAASTDILMSQCENLTTGATPLNYRYDPPVAFTGPHTLEGENMGGTKTATLILYYLVQWPKQ